MAARVTTYDPKSVALIIAGVPMGGFAEDMITIEFSEDSWEHLTGADGEEIRIKKNDRRAELTVRFIQSSESNTFLAALQQTDEATGAGTFPVLFKDNNGATLVSSESAWIKKTPSITRGRGPQDVEWVLSLSQARAFVGGYS